MTSIAHLLALPRQLCTLLSAWSLVRVTLRLGLLRLAACWALICLTACATGPKTVTHSFSCDMWNDGWADQADLIEYAYGDKFPMLHKRTRPDQKGLGCGKVWTAMPVGEFLYVKWRLKATGEVIEDRVDLRGRLPSDMFNQEITFVIDGRQLYVYLVTPTPPTQRLEKPPLRTWLSEFHLAYEIYPANQLKKTDA